MLIDTHCHINMIVKKEFDIPLTELELNEAKFYIDQASDQNVKKIINVGTSLTESLNCIELAKKYPNIFATIGIHPNDLNQNYKIELEQLKILLKNKIGDKIAPVIANKIAPVIANKIVGIGECGMDKHYPEYDLKKQEFGFRYQIELAIENDLGLVVHTRDAAQETLNILKDYHNNLKRVIIHCFSEDQSFADKVLSWGFFLGIGGTITYPKNNNLRSIVQNTPLEKIVLETDAPFLPPQYIRGKMNTPKEIFTIANYVAELKGESLDSVEKITTNNSNFIFRLNNHD